MQDTEIATKRLVAALRGASHVGCLTGAGVLRDLRLFADAILSI